MKGFEPSTSTLARLRSTPELHPRCLKKESSKRPVANRNMTDARICQESK